MAKRKPKRARRIVISSLITFAVLVAAWMGYRAHAAETADSYVTTSASKGDVDQYLDLSGSVSEENQSSVGFPASGTVTSVHVAVGDTVHAGQKLATIDDSDLKLAVTQAKADLAAAKDELTQAEQSADDAASASASPSASSSAATGTTGSGSQSTANQGTSNQGSTGSGSQGSGSQGSGSTGSGSQGSGSQGSGSTGSGTQGSGGSASSGGNTGNGGTGGSTSGGTGADQAQLKKLQQQVTKDTQNLARLQKTETAAITNQQQLCSFLGSTSPTAPSSKPTSPSSSATSTGTPSPSVTPSTSPSESPTESASPTPSPTEASSTSPTETPTATSTQTPTATATATPSATDSAQTTDSTTGNITDSGFTTQNADARTGTGGVEPVDEPSQTSSSSPSQPDDQDLQKCLTAMQQTSTAQAAVSSQQQLTSRDIAALTTAVQKLGTTAPSGTSTSPSSSATPSGGKSSSPSGTNPSSPSTSQSSSGTSGTGSRAQGSTGQQPSGNSSSTSTGSSTGTSGTVPSSSSRTSGGNGSTSSAGGQGSSTTVAEAKAAITTAKINLNVAKQKLAQATITSPIDGVIAALDFAKGDAVSTSDRIVITGHGAMSVTVDVPGTKLDSIKTGQDATVGTDSAGTVTAIGLLPADDSSSSETSYPVTITVPDPGDDLADGATTTARINISHVQNVLRIPISAVTRSGSTGTVRVLKNGEPQITSVGIGAVGASMVQITSGLSAGDVVVIADNSEALPSSNSSTSRGSFNRIGGGTVVQVNGSPGGVGTQKR